VHINYIIFDYEQIFLQFLLHFSFENTIIASICYFAVLQILRNLHENEFSDSRSSVSSHHTIYMLL